MPNPFHLLKKKRSAASQYRPDRNLLFKPLGMMLSPLSRPSLSNFVGLQKSIGFGDGKQRSSDYTVRCNSSGFRSDEFKTDHSGMHIVFGGCSETFGEGGPLEDCWAHKAYTAISNNVETSGYFNIGFPGKGYQDIINLALQYFDKYGNPDCVILAFPSLLRKITWVDTNDLNLDSDFNPEEFQSGYYILMPQKTKKVSGANTGIYRIAGNGLYVNRGFTSSDMKTEYASFHLAIKMFEEICRSRGINFLWTLLDMSDQEVAKRITDEFSHNFVAALALDSETLEFIAENPQYTFEKPDGHRGTADHTIWSNRIVSRFFYMQDIGWKKHAKE
jgi:hypothetical protein